jgi:hypothetical protein
VNTATFVSNLLSTPSRSNFSPYELWTKSSAPIHRIRTFGCKAFICVPKSHQSWKLGNTAEVGILVGFENEATVFRILRLSDKKLIRTRHAFFDESSFPKFSDDFVPSTIADLSFFEESFDEDSDTDDPPATEVVSPNENLSSTQNAMTVATSTNPSSELIVGDISSSNILSTKRVRKPRAFHTTESSDIPAHYHRAEAKSWEIAIKKELDAMATLNVWSVVPLTPDIKTVGTTWFFKKKTSDQDVVFKARLCAQGFSQTHGIDFLKTFTPTGHLTSLRALISYGCKRPRC